MLSRDKHVVFDHVNIVSLCSVISLDTNCGIGWLNSTQKYPFPDQTRLSSPLTLRPTYLDCIASFPTSPDLHFHLKKVLLVSHQLSLPTLRHSNANSASL